MGAELNDILSCRSEIGHPMPRFSGIAQYKRREASPVYRNTHAQHSISNTCLSSRAQLMGNGLPCTLRISAQREQ